MARPDICELRPAACTLHPARCKQPKLRNNDHAVPSQIGLRGDTSIGVYMPGGLSRLDVWLAGLYGYCTICSPADFCPPNPVDAVRAVRAVIRNTETQLGRTTHATSQVVLRARVVCLVPPRRHPILRDAPSQDRFDHGQQTETHPLLGKKSR